MTKYSVAFGDLQNQASEFQNAQGELNDFESRLNSIADSMDDRDESMATLKQQLKNHSRSIPAIVNRVNAIAASIAGISEIYKNAEKKCYQDFSVSDKTQDKSTAPEGSLLSRAAGVTLATLNKHLASDVKLRKSDKTAGYKPIAYVKKTVKDDVTKKSISSKNKGTGKDVNSTQTSQNDEKEYDKLKKEFEEIDKENAGINWDGCTDELIAAKKKFEALIKEKGWTIHYSSAHRSYEWQEHLYDVVKKIKENKFTSEKIKQLYLHEKEKLGLGTVVAKPNKNAPHVKGIAFDATVYDEKGNKLNTKYKVNNVLLELANKAGLKNNIQDDRVHFEV